jgi:hypothetical protein
METFEECIKKMIVFLCKQEEIVMVDEVIKEENKKKGVKDTKDEIVIKRNSIDKIFSIYNHSTGLQVEGDGRRKILGYTYKYSSDATQIVKTDYGYVILDLYSDEFLNNFLKLETLGNYEGFWADPDEHIARFIFENYTIEIDIIQSKKYKPTKNPIKKKIKELVLCFHSIPEPSVPLATPIASYNGERDYADYYLESGIPVTTVSGLITVPDENVEQVPQIEPIEPQIEPPIRPEPRPSNPIPRNTLKDFRKLASRITGLRNFFGRGGKTHKRKNIKTKRKKR